MNRRQLVKLGASAAFASALPASGQRFGPVLAFAKHLQWLSFDEVAVFLEENDLDGIEATVRKGGTSRAGTRRTRSAAAGPGSG